MTDVNFLKMLAGSLGTEIDIHFHESPEGKRELHLKGTRPCLFHAACEIVKAVAMNEPAFVRRELVDLVCDTVLKELSEKGN